MSPTKPTARSEAAGAPCSVSVKTSRSGWMWCQSSSPCTHVYGKWACRHCQTLKQAPSVPEIVEGGIAASGLLAHTAISRFVDHLPYYRQESINAPSGVHTRAQPWSARRDRWTSR